jgi:uncharacterized membrane protein YesL
MVGRVMWRAFGRGLRDLLDNLLPMAVASLAWWGTLLLIVTAPAGTLALFTFTDPNRLSEHLRPVTAELKARVRREFGPAWFLAIVFGLPIVALVSNLTVYGGRSRSFGVLTVLWVVLLLLTLAAAGIACSLRAVHGYGYGQAVRAAIVGTLAHTTRLLPVLILLWVIVAIGGLLVVPAVMFVPALIALVFNHMTYALLGVTVADPLDPTAERAAEQARTAGSKYSVN